MNLIINRKIINDVELVIFDRDGTLIDLYVYLAWMVEKRAELICKKLNLKINHKKNLVSAMGIDKKNKKIKFCGPVGLKKREIVMQKAADYLFSIGQNDASSLCIDVFKEVDILSLANLKAIIKPVDSLYAIVNKLLDSSCRIAIATNDLTQRAMVAMDFLGLTKHIDFIVGEDCVKKSKPAPDMVKLILHTLKIDRNNAVMIGDAVSDVKMGNNARLKASIGVLSGLSSADDFKMLTPYVINSIADLKISNKGE